MTSRIRRAVCAAALILATPADAQEAPGDLASQVPFEERSGPAGFIALGAGAVPRFEGAESYQPIPFAIADVHWKGLEFELRGLRARIDMFGDSPFQFGPAINYRFKRDSAGDGKGRVRRLDDVNSAI